MSLQEDRERDPLLTFGEIAELARGGTTERQVKRWADDGKLAVVRLPRGRRVLLSAWQEFIEARTTPAAVSTVAQAERTAQLAGAAKAREAQKPASVRRPRRSKRVAVA
jgi:hypothetical protein